MGHQATSPPKKKTGRHEEGEHERVQHVQGENYQRNVLRVFVI